MVIHPAFSTAVLSRGVLSRPGAPDQRPHVALDRRCYRKFFALKIAVLKFWRAEQLAAVAP
jgi:hypothetical protein